MAGTTGLEPATSAVTEWQGQWIQGFTWYIEVQKYTVNARLVHVNCALVCALVSTAASGHQSGLQASKALVVASSSPRNTALEYA
jgi:hypothetical protein